ncbi:peptidase M61 [Roseivirga sp.]|uniref:M61 family metallopeptidase n=1 Tax=Roseivirga sp. TaxID=1964215 RepID=UPI002B278F94|nr:peptidase M61 [Roseivirga sp.]
MNKLKFICLGLLFTTLTWAAKPYKYIIDLTRVSDDKVYVELAPPKIKQDEIIFYLPKIIPGTYAIADYGRMVSDFEAFDKKGNSLEVKRLDDNTWKISNAKKIAKISYWVDDTYDNPKEGAEIFQPAGTNIAEGENFLLNSSGFFGYFEGMKKETFELNIIRPKSFYGATGLKAEATNTSLSRSLRKRDFITPDVNSTIDRFEVSDYDRLVDSPLMYSKADTAVIKVANTEVLVASYSPNKKVTAKEIAASIKEVLAAQSTFLGGKLPVEKYAFIFYFTDQPVVSYGALEHSFSSLYFMPEQTIQQMNQQLRDFAAHEFFHIVTPLTIHSEEIGSFDFNDPKMSRHLWMYEGMTEYFAGSVQVKYGLVSPDEYLDMLREKILTSAQFKDDLPFTELSLGALDTYADQYYNVYMKGALIGMALDIKLRKLSDGAYGVQDMMAGLSKKYGMENSFQDEQLFSEIVAMTYPEVGVFLNTYVAGNTPINYEEVLAEVGVNVIEGGTTKQYSLIISQESIAAAEYNGKRMLAIGNQDKLDAMGKALGLQNGDIITKMNGDELPELGPEINNFLGGQFQKIPELKTMSVTVMRTVDGEPKEITLTAPNQQIDVPVALTLAFDEDATPAQLKLRKAWLEPKN